MKTSSRLLPLFFAVFALSFMTLAVSYAEDDKTATTTEDIKEDADEGKDASEAEKKTEDKKPVIVPEPKPEPPAPKLKTFPALSESRAEDIESTGILRNISDGALGKDMWRGAKRSELITLIKSLAPMPEEYPALQRLYKGILLSRADASLIENDVEIKHGEDLLTLRLQKLLELGMYDKASQLYTALDKEPYSAALAKAGIQAHLANNETSLACLELQIAKDVLEDESSFETFFKNITLYCQSILDTKISDETKKAINNSGNDILKNALLKDGYKFDYNVKEFGKLSLFTKSVLNAQNRINVDKLPDLEDIPSQDLILLSRNASLSMTSKIRLSGEALRRGLISLRDIEDLYKSIILPATGNDKDEAGLKPHEKLALYYKQAGRTRGEERREYIGKAMKTEDTYGLYALAPFASYMGYEDWSGADWKNLSGIITLLHVTHQSIPSAFFDWIDSGYEKNKNQKNADSLYLATFLTASPRMKEERKDKINSILENHNSKSKLFHENVMKIVDSDMSNNDNADKVYENAFDLTLFIDYVMPSHNVWRRLVIASNNKKIAETALWSTYVFRGKQPKDTYPGLWRDVLHGLDAVGLNEISDELAVSALLAEE